jgi:alkylation response protein AidB-like acyl-CoA dehydrogenase
MRLDLSEDQELFSRADTRFLQNSAPIAVVREWADAEPAGYPHAWWQEGAALGWTALLVPEDLGGGSISAHGLLDLALLAEERGRLVSPGPLVPVNVAADLVVRAGNGEQRARVLSGLERAAWCVEEADRPFGIDTMRAEARRTETGFVLDGVKAPVEGTADADWLVVVARSDDGPRQLLVAPDTPGSPSLPSNVST